MENNKDIIEAADKWVFGENGMKWSNNDNTAGDNYGSFIAGAEWAIKKLEAEKAELLEALEDCKERLENMNKRLIEVDGYSRLSVYFASKLNSLIQKHKQ